MKLEWGDPSKFQLNLVFDLGFPSLLTLATLLDRISDLDVLFGNDPLKLERPPSKRFKHCVYAEEVTSAASTLKDVTNHKRLDSTSPEREKAAHGVIPSNTEVNTLWAEKNFISCTTNHSAVNPHILW